MGLDWRYNESNDRILLKGGEPKSKLKVTGTRFGGILGLNPWSTPFQMWCEITKAARPPFEDTKYTLAGKAIEPKQIQWTKEQVGNNVLSPEEYFGNRYKEVKYDFYPGDKIFGGMWDAKNVLKNGKTTDIFEYKTTKRAEDWVGQPPVYYLLQVLEYAYLEGAKRVHLVVSFLEDDDYNHPENYEVNDDNTQIFTYNVATTYINIDNGDIMDIRDENEVPVNCFDISMLIRIAEQWYDDHIKTGRSPKFDEVKDKEYLDILRTSKPQNDLGENDLVSKANELIKKINKIKKETNLDDLEKQLKACETGIKENLMKEMSDTTDKVVLGNYTLSKTVRKTTSFNEDQMKQDGVYDRYVKETEKETYTLRKTKEK